MNNATETRSDYHVAMEAMRAHHLSRKGGDFFAAQPQFQSLAVAAPQFSSFIVADAVSTADNQTAPDSLRPVTTALASQQQGVADAATSGVNDAANTLKTSQNVSDFNARMEAQRHKALQDSDANINAAFDKAIDLGKDADPVTQSALLAGMNIAQNIVSKFSSLITDMVGKVMSLIKDILKGIMDSLRGVLQGFGGEALEMLGGLL
jgi:hypothetical protein